MKRSIFVSNGLLPVTTALVLTGLFWGCQRIEQAAITEAEAQLAAHQMMQVWNEGKMELVDELFAAEVLVSGDAMSHETMTRDGLKMAIEKNRTAFPDMQVIIEDWFIKGDKLMYHWTATGTNTGPLEQGPPTGETVKCAGVTMVRIVDGKAVEMAEFYNELDVMRQLGFTIVPPEPQS